MMRRLRHALGRFRRSERGTAALEFAISVPILMLIFAGSFESGLLMLRSIMLDQGVDRTMRELRLGHYPAPTAALLKQEICSRSVILKDCMSNITIEMVRISTSTWTMPTTAIQCVNREEEVVPVTALQIGQQNDVMMVRICVIQDAIFPNMAIGRHVGTDSKGGYALVTTTAFVTEPS
jgi:hypothetical protein